MKERNKQKDSVWTRFKKFGNDHLVQILMGILFAGGSVAGYMIAKDRCYGNGYADGMKEFRKQHIDTALNLIDECGHESAFLALDHVRSSDQNYKLLMKDPDAVVRQVGEKYYQSGYIKNLTDIYTKELESYT